LLERLAAPEVIPEGLDDGARPGKIIACYSPKGGAGRSTLAVNLAIALFRATGRETILVDGACFHGDLDLFLNLQPQQGLASVLAGSRLDGALCPHPTGIKLLGWTKGDREEAAEKLRNLMHLLRQRDAWVVVDTHPALREANRVVLELSDRVYVPMFLDIAHIRGIQRDLSQWREERLDTARFELVAWGEKSDVSRQEAGKILRRGIDFQLHADPVGARSAINQGVPLLQADPRGAFARDLDRLIASFTEPQTRALVEFKAVNPFEQFIAWVKKGPATGFGA
jgi:pilus assembly protein CpaE